ncbi:hypothetical protein C8R32_10229 [Nitrosospira sp. Nsp5]|uniref:Uncharacterized protein n=1 Tax=Nitrosospira multiformis TaxID=1231 RepID=A0ABY0TL89_9PROT|nr:hypothetical protein C8R32_10229 [Nitrosospira sp. Nsp5]SDR00809.1 hypothetical protein SAMN05216402_3227 [Nitrosospira multiformis]
MQVTLLRSSGRGLAILVSVGRERDPNRVNGKIKMLPTRIKISSVTKKELMKDGYQRRDGSIMAMTRLPITSP